MKTFFFFLFLFLAGFTLSAQVNIAGKVVNAMQMPVRFASVTLKKATSDKSQTAQTDSLGSFKFSMKDTGKYKLTISFIGYNTTVLSIELYRDTTLNIQLTPSDTHLNEVTISATKPVIENSPDQVVYNVASDLTASGADALTAIGKIPGVKVNDNQISIVGKGTVKVMINDQLIQLEGINLSRFLKSIAANQVSTIELIKNPPANFDADGNAGLINITTKQSKKKGYSGNVQFNAKRWLHDPATVYGTSDYEAVNGSAYINYNTEKWSLFGSLTAGQDHELEGFETDLFYPKQKWLQTDTGNYRYHSYDFIAGVNYKLGPKTTIGLTYIGGTNTYDGSDHVNNPIYNSAGGRDSTLKTYATYHPVAITNAVDINAVIRFDTTGKKLSFNADYFNYYRTDRSDFETNTYLADGSLNESSNTKYHDTNKQNINIYTFNADAAIPAKFAKLFFGGKLSFINNYSNAFYYNVNQQDQLSYNTDLSNEFSYKENTQSLYFSINKETGKWKIMAGLRGEFTQTDGFSYTLNKNTVYNYFKLFPSLSLSFQADADNSLALTFGRRVNRPTFWNLNPFKSLYTAYSYSEGNPYLQPEYNSNLELSHTYKNLLTSSIFFNVTDNGFNNITIARPDTSLVYTIPLNFIKTYRYGLSENVRFNSGSWLESNETATFYHTQAFSALADIKNIQAYSFYIATNNTIYFNKDKTFAGAVNFWYQHPEIDHVGLSDAYYKLDFGFKVSALNKKLDIALNFNDVFRSSATAVSTTVDGVQQKFTNFQLNRYVLLSLSYKFSKNPTEQANNSTGNEDERQRIH